MADSKKEDIIRRCQCMRMTVDAGYNLKGMLLTGNQCKGMFNSLGQIILNAEEMQKTIENLEERIAIMSEGGWHDAEKDQPKETDCYIVRIDYGVGQMTTMREYVSSEGKWLKSIEEKITHWMPLPKPPKG